MAIEDHTGQLLMQRSHALEDKERQLEQTERELKQNAETLRQEREDMQQMQQRSTEESAALPATTPSANPPNNPTQPCYPSKTSSTQGQFMWCVPDTGLAGTCLVTTCTATLPSTLLPLQLPTALAASLPPDLPLQLAATIPTSLPPEQHVVPPSIASGMCGSSGPWKSKPSVSSCEGSADEHTDEPRAVLPQALPLPGQVLQVPLQPFPPPPSSVLPAPPSQRALIPSALTPSLIPSLIPSAVLPPQTGSAVRLAVLPLQAVLPPQAVPSQTPEAQTQPLLCPFPSAVLPLTQAVPSRTPQAQTQQTQQMQERRQPRPRVPPRARHPPQQMVQPTVTQVQQPTQPVVRPTRPAAMVKRLQLAVQLASDQLAVSTPPAIVTPPGSLVPKLTASQPSPTPSIGSQQSLSFLRLLCAARPRCAHLWLLALPCPLLAACSPRGAYTCIHMRALPIQPLLTQRCGDRDPPPQAAVHAALCGEDVRQLGGTGDTTTDGSNNPHGPLEC